MIAPPPEPGPKLGRSGGMGTLAFTDHPAWRRAVHWSRRVWRFAREEVTAVAALAVIAGGLAAFVEIADDMTEADGRAFDQAVLAQLRPHADPADAWGPPWLEEAMIDLTSLGGIAVLALFALAVMGFLLINRKHLSALMLPFALAGGVILSETCKDLFGRDRPPAELAAVETINASFPSGHALLATVFYLTVAVMLARTMARKRVKAYVIGAGVLLALLVGVSRVYLAAHWATDVLAGWSLGAAWAMACWLAAYAIERTVVKRAAGLRDAPVPPNGAPVDGA